MIKITVEIDRGDGEFGCFSKSFYLKDVADKTERMRVIGQVEAFLEAIL